MSYGTALITDVVPKTLEDYEQTSLDSLTLDAANLTIPHEEIISLALKKEEQRPRKRDFFVSLTMRMHKEVSQVDDVEVVYRPSPHSDSTTTVYTVPLGAECKP